ncbi:hypothetical protein VaNZ11_015967 [Volvox africanus]|uniref:Sulfotransferase n=1 Tax=Volvox africanus TaxID=51714 RepID=A0ABQ5SM37_9CHLO|nr:hypothetical protein VaNZ11_015967 [Volvox africanus]
MRLAVDGASKITTLLLLIISFALQHSVVFAYPGLSVLGPGPKPASTISETRVGGDGQPFQLQQLPQPSAYIGDLPVSKKCVFILATGRSGSTSLMDALNQIPNYLVRGEHWRAVGNMYDAYRRFQDALMAAERHSLRFDGGNVDSVYSIKQVYDTKLATQAGKDLGLFNEFGSDRVLQATRAYYASLYGYYGEDVVSGFKEIRYVCGKFLPAARKCGLQFQSFMGFLQSLCTDVKLIFNSRNTALTVTNLKLYLMDQSNLRDPLDFALDLGATHTLYDYYVRKNPSHAFRVYMEDMFDPQKNATLARDLLTFLGEDPKTPIAFDRMPPWNTGKSS